MGSAQIGKAQIEKLDDKGLKDNYDKLVALFKSVQRNTPKIMHELIKRIYNLGLQMNPKYTVKNHLCKDLGISYKQYRFYQEYKFVDEEKEKLIKHKEMSSNTLLYIIHSFPHEDVNKVINMMVKYSLSRDDLDTLKKDGKYKDEEEWKGISDNKDYARKKYKNDDSKWNNSRRVRGTCQVLNKILKNIYCGRQNTKYEIYNELFNTYNKIGDWLAKHKSWDAQEQKKEMKDA